MSLLNTLQPWQWALFASIPLTIIALYFLKLRRQPRVVPSTYLWTRAIEDLHVNSLWQRLRRSILLLLQLLLIAILMAACIRPAWRGSQLQGDRFVFLIDTSASMSATDVRPNRLEVAKQRLLKMIDQMKSGDAALLVSFSDVARVEQSFTDNRGLLRDKVNRLRSIDRKSDLQEALRVAAGLANPGRVSEDVGDVRTAGALPATLYILSDGGFAPVKGFALGNLTPVYIAIGQPRPDNVGIVAFSVERNPAKGQQLEAFARFENSGDEDAQGDVALSIDGRLSDATQLRVPRQGEASVKFELGELEQGVLEIDWQRNDQLALDNSASLAVGMPRRARVLLVTPGNESLKLALTTEEAEKVADVTVAGIAYLETNEYREASASGEFDLIIYDRCVPKEMPACNTLFVGNVPPEQRWSKGPLQPLPYILDTDRAHPLTGLVDMGGVRYIYDGFPIRGPAGALTLFEASIGPLLVVAQRSGYEDAALGMEIIGKDSQGAMIPKTDWPSRSSFPVFAMNLLTYLGGLQTAATPHSIQPGTAIHLRAHAGVERIRVKCPSGEEQSVRREGQPTFQFSGTQEQGIYEVFENSATEASQRFAVNLMDSQESRLATRRSIDLGFESVAAKPLSEPARRELWKVLVLAGLAVLVLEWYVFNRRIFF